MKEDKFSKWIQITIQQICEENHLDVQNWEQIKFFVFEEISKRFDVLMNKYTPN